MRHTHPASLSWLSKANWIARIEISVAAVEQIAVRAEPDHSLAAMWVGVRMWSFMACQVRTAAPFHPASCSRSIDVWLANVRAEPLLIHILLHYAPTSPSCFPPSHACAAWRVQIQEALPDSSHEYVEWILTYASEEYLELPAKHEHLIDTLGPAQPYGAPRPHGFAMES